MILLKTYCAFGVLAPLLLVLAKYLGWISFAWGWVIALSTFIPLAMFLFLLALAIWIIKSTPWEEWQS